MDLAWFLAQIVFALRESDWTQVLDFFWLDDNKIPTNICWIFWGSRVWGKLGWIFRETVSKCTRIWFWWTQNILLSFPWKGGSTYKFFLTDWWGKDDSSDPGGVQLKEKQLSDGELTELCEHVNERNKAAQLAQRQSQLLFQVWN